MSNFTETPNEQFSPNEFGEEYSINFQDLDIFDEPEIGRGAFGTVVRAVWEGQVVAVKIIDMSCGVKEYQDEVQQLSNVRHHNIIQLFGTSMCRQKVYIVMEFADCGSLYDLLHPGREEDMIAYNLGHVVRWSLQCAQAVEYLHSLKPMVVHRDLKPPNMLLTDYGKVIKICDFGTATQIKTEMTSNKGSAAWMAPEVFEGKRYSEKCDIYSFGIVLWEMLSRKKPFDEIGPPAFRILWAVYNGTRPPPLKDVPESLMNLMDNCWAKDPSKRPSFSDIVEFFTVLDGLIEGAEESIFYYDEEYTAYNYDPTDPNYDPNSIIKQTPPETPPVTPQTPEWSNMFPSADQMHFDNNPSYQRHPTVLHNPPPAEQQQPPQYYTPYKQHDNSTQLSPISFQSGSSPRNGGDFSKIPSLDSATPEYGDMSGSPSKSSFQADWSVVPEHLMPVKPITTVPVSVKLYDNYIEALKKYIDLQVKIKDLKVQEGNLESQIIEVDKTQKNNAFYLERYVKLANDKSELLEHHQTIKSILEDSKMNRSRTHTP